MSIAQLRKSNNAKFITGLLTAFSVMAGDLQAAPLAAAGSPGEAAREIPAAAELSLPPAYGIIEETHEGKGNGLVILIQDAHAVPEAQENIRRILGWLAETQGIELAGTEGAAAPIDATLFRSFPDKTVLEDVFAAYMQAQELTGPNAAALFGPETMKHVGLENWKLYEEGIRYYLEASRSEPGARDYLKKARQELQERKKEEYSQQLYEMDSALEAFYLENKSLAAVLEKLSNVLPPEKNSAVGLVLEELKNETERGALTEELNAEAEKVFQILSRKMDDQLRAFIPELNRKRQEHATSKISDSAMALYLHELIERIRGKAAEVFPGNDFSASLIFHAGREKRLRDIEGSAFFEEFEAYAAKVKESLFETERAQMLDHQSRRLYLTAKLSALELTWKELLELEAESPAPEEAALFNAHRNFYRTALKRDAVFYENLAAITRKTPRLSSAAVVGGFHIQGLREALKEGGFSYAVVRPQISKIPEENLYRGQMKSEVSWRKYFENEDGKVDLHKAFIRAARDKLIQAYKQKHETEKTAELIKEWKSILLRNLDKTNRLDQAPLYTRFLDETVRQGWAPSDSSDAWRANLFRFVEGLKNLEQRGELDGQHISRLLKTMKSVAPAPANIFSIAFIDAAIVFGNTFETAGEPDPVLRSELRGSGDTQDSWVAKAQALIDEWNSIQPEHGNDLFEPTSPTNAQPKYQHRLTRFLSDEYPSERHQQEKEFSEFLMYSLLHPDFKVRRQAVVRLVRNFRSDPDYLIEHFKKPWISYERYGLPLMYNGNIFNPHRAIRSKRLALLSVFAILGSKKTSGEWELEEEHAGRVRERLNGLFSQEAEAMREEGTSALDFLRHEAEVREDRSLDGKSETGLLKGTFLEMLRYKYKVDINGNADPYGWLNKLLHVWLSETNDQTVKQLYERIKDYPLWNPWELKMDFPEANMNIRRPENNPSGLEKALSDPEFISATLYNLLPDFSAASLTSVSVEPNPVVPGTYLITFFDAAGKTGKVVFHEGSEATEKKYIDADKLMAASLIYRFFPRFGASFSPDDTTRVWTVQHVENEYNYKFDLVAETQLELGRRGYAFEKIFTEKDIAVIRDHRWDAAPFIPSIETMIPQPWTKKRQRNLIRGILNEAATRDQESVLETIRMAKNYAGKGTLTRAFLGWRLSILFDELRRKNAPGIFSVLRTIWNKTYYESKEPVRLKTAGETEARSELRADELRIDEPHPDARHMIDEWNLIQAEHGNDLFSAITAVLARPGYEHRFTLLLSDEADLREFRGKREFYDFLMYAMLHPDFKVRRQAVNHLILSGKGNVYIPADYLIEHFKSPWLSIDMYGDPVAPSGLRFNRSQAIRAKRLALLSAFGVLGNLEQTEKWNTDQSYAEAFRARIAEALKDESAAMLSEGVTALERIRNLARKRHDAVLSEERKMGLLEGTYLELLRYKYKKEAGLNDPLGWLHKDLQRWLLLSSAPGAATIYSFIEFYPETLPWEPGLKYPAAAVTAEALDALEGNVRQALEDPAFVSATLHNLFPGLTAKSIKAVRAAPEKEERPGQLTSYEVEVENEEGKKVRFILYAGKKEIAESYRRADTYVRSRKGPPLFPRLGAIKEAGSESSFFSVEKIQNSFRMNRLFLSEAALFLARRGYILNGPFTENDIAFIEGPGGVPHTVFLKPNDLESLDSNGSRNRHMMLELFKTFSDGPADETLDLLRLAKKHISRIDIAIAFTRWRSSAARDPLLRHNLPRVSDVFRALLFEPPGNAPRPEKIEVEVRSELRETEETALEKSRQLSRIVNVFEWYKLLPDTRLHTAHAAASFLWKFWPELGDFARARGFETLTHWLDAMRSDVRLTAQETEAFKSFAESNPEISVWLKDVADPQRLSLFFRYPRHYAWLYGEIVRRLREAKEGPRELKLDLIGPGFYQEPLSLLSLIKTAYLKEQVTLEEVKLELNIFDKNESIQQLFQEGNLVFSYEEISYWPEFYATAVALNTGETYAEEAALTVEELPGQFASLFKHLTDPAAGNSFAAPDADSPWIKAMVFRGDYLHAGEKASSDYALLNYVGIYLDGEQRVSFMKKIHERLSSGGFAVAIGSENLFHGWDAFAPYVRLPAIYQKIPEAEPEKRSELRVPEERQAITTALSSESSDNEGMTNLLLAIKPGADRKQSVEELSSFVVAAIEQNNVSVFSGELERTFTEMASAGTPQAESDIFRRVYLTAREELLDALRAAVLPEDRKAAVAVDIPARMASSSMQLAEALQYFSAFVGRAGFTGEGRQNQELMSRLRKAGIGISTHRAAEDVLEEGGWQKLVPLVHDSGSAAAQDAKVLAFGVSLSGLENDTEAVRYYAESYAALTSTGLAAAAALSGETREQMVERFRHRRFEGLRPEVTRLLEALLLKQYGNETGPVIIVSGDNRILTSAAAMKAYFEFRAEEQFARSA